MEKESLRSKDPVKLRIADIRPNQDVAGVFVVEEKQLRRAKTGKPFLTLTLRDKTGSLTARLWENAAEAAQIFTDHKVFRIQGRSEQFRDELQIHVHKADPVPVESVDPSDFLPVCPRDRQVLWNECKNLLKNIKAAPYHTLIRCFLSDKSLMQRFVKAPAAKSIHHAYLGGLLEHTVGVMRLTNLIAAQYPSLDRDLLLLGAFLHDIGKIHEFTYDLVIDHSDVGRLVGHMVLGVEILDEKLAVCQNFPRETGMLLKHLILSHHGETDYGAVQLPMTREAFALHFADDLDAKINSVDEIISKSENPDSTWTEFHNLYKRYFYKGQRKRMPVVEEPIAPRLGSGIQDAPQLSLWPAETQKGHLDDDF